MNRWARWWDDLAGAFWGIAVPLALAGWVLLELLELLADRL